MEDIDFVRPPYEEVKKEYKQLASEFLKKYPNPSCIDILQSEKDKQDFVLAFRDIIRKPAEIQIYEDYNEEADELGMTAVSYTHLDVYKRQDAHRNILTLTGIHTGYETVQNQCIQCRCV